MRLPNFIFKNRKLGYRSVRIRQAIAVRVALLLIVFAAAATFNQSNIAFGQLNDQSVGQDLSQTASGSIPPSLSEPSLASTRSSTLDREWYYNGWSGPGFVLLKSGNVIHGDVITQGNGLLVRLDNTGEINLGSSNVVAVKESLLGLYDYQVARVVRWESGEHWNLAKWCLRNGLMDQAYYHYLKLKAVAGSHPSFKRMEAEIKSELLLDPVVKEALRARNVQQASANPTSLASNDESPKPSPEAVPISELAKIEVNTPKVKSAVDTSHLVLDRYTQEFFRQQVYPFLVLKCGQAGCHGGSGKSEFQITRSGSQRNRRTSDASLATTIQYVVDSNFEQTPLFSKATAAHGNRNNAPLEMNTPADRELVERLRYWHAALHRNTYRPIASPQVANAVRPTQEFPRLASNGNAAPTSPVPMSNPAQVPAQVMVEPNTLVPEVGSGLLMLEREIAKLEAIEKARKTCDLHNPAEFNKQFGTNP
ncbi:MAG: hypothetical protein NTW52_14830 [Planctomycetota bacterium]|nr:hypothetical protein [Planctomycetota bacterium]